MKVTFLWDYYPSYVADFYERHPSAIGMSFENHRSCLLNDHFGWPGELSTYMRCRGIETEFFVYNDDELQSKWALQHGVTVNAAENRRDTIALRQVEVTRPDVLWIPFGPMSASRFVKQAAKSAGRVALWMGSPFVEEMDVDGISILVTENPATLRQLHSRFEKVVVTKPGFDQRVLEGSWVATRDIDVAVIGQISKMHSRRTELLSFLLENGIDLQVWGYTHDDVVSGSLNGVRQAAWHLRHTDWQGFASSLRQALFPTKYERRCARVVAIMHGPVFGVEMYKRLSRALLTVNVHIDVAGDNAGNMRMFQATGCGSCLVTEHSENISDLFEPEHEVLTYRTKEELLEVVRDALRNRERTRAIGRAGQERTLRQHSLHRFFLDISEAFGLRRGADSVSGESDSGAGQPNAGCP